MDQHLNQIGYYQVYLVILLYLSYYIIIIYYYLGVFLVGAYPASQDDAETFDLLTNILKQGITKFVCLQQEYRAHGVTEAMWRNGLALRPYYNDVVQIVSNKNQIESLKGFNIVDSDKLSFVHFPIRDCDITDDDRVIEVAKSLVKAIGEGERLYLHCWGGHGRTGTLVSIMLHLMYKLDSIAAMARCQEVHDLRQCPVAVGSPQTQTQRDQVTRIINRLIKSHGFYKRSFSENVRSTGGSLSHRAEALQSPRPSNSNKNSTSNDDIIEEEQNIAIAVTPKKSPLSSPVSSPINKSENLPSPQSSSSSSLFPVPASPPSNLTNAFATQTNLLINDTQMNVVDGQSEILIDDSNNIHSSNETTNESISNVADINSVEGVVQMSIDECDYENTEDDDNSGIRDAETVNAKPPSGPAPSSSLLNGFRQWRGAKT